MTISHLLHKEIETWRLNKSPKFTSLVSAGEGLDPDNLAQPSMCLITTLNCLSIQTWMFPYLQLIRLIYPKTKHSFLFSVQSAFTYIFSFDLCISFEK